MKVHPQIHTKTYKKDDDCLSDVIISLCCGAFISVSFTVLMIFLVNKEDEILNSSSSE